MNRQLISICTLTCAVIFAPAVGAQGAGDPAAVPTTTSDSTDKSTATFDVRTGELRITCLKVSGIKEKGSLLPDAEYDAVMIQRGSSSNWEITFVSPGCGETEKMPAAEIPEDKSNDSAGDSTGDNAGGVS